MKNNYGNFSVQHLEDFFALLLNQKFLCHPLFCMATPFLDELWLTVTCHKWIGQIQLTVQVRRSFVRFNNHGAEFGGPFGLERTHTTQRDRAHTRKATRKLMHMRDSWRSKSGVGGEAGGRRGEARKYSTVKVLHVSKFTAPDDDVTITLLYARCEFLAGVGEGRRCCRS